MTTKVETPLEKYISLPEKHPSELIGGEIKMTPSPSFKHQNVAKLILLKLTEVAKDSGVVIYELDVHFDDENVLRPDIVYVSDESKIKEYWIEGAPDIIVEVISPSTAVRDLVEKKEIYEKFGVKEYWAVNPDSEEVIVFENKDGKFEVLCHGKSCESKVLKGFNWGFE